MGDHHAGDTNFLHKFASVLILNVEITPLCFLKSMNQIKKKNTLSFVFYLDLVYPCDFLTSSCDFFFQVKAHFMKTKPLYFFFFPQEILTECDKHAGLTPCDCFNFGPKFYTPRDFV